MSIYAIYHVSPRTMVTIARFLSWLPDLRPILARRAILDGAAGAACLDDLCRARSMFENSQNLFVGSTAASAIIEAYKAGSLPLKDGKKPGKTTRAEVYARSPLRPPQDRIDTV